MNQMVPYYFKIHGFWTPNFFKHVVFNKAVIPRDQFQWPHFEKKVPDYYFTKSENFQNKFKHPWFPDFEVVTSRAQLKVSAAHRSDTKIWINHKGVSQFCIKNFAFHNAEKLRFLRIVVILDKKVIRKHPIFVF